VADKKRKTNAEWQHEAFEMVEIHRSQLKNAPYNPRQIRDTNRKKLERVLKKFALVGPLGWNKRTGNIAGVGGHQRIAIIDKLKGTQDYTLHVAAIDVDEAQEREMNIAVNNAEAMGEMDVAKLGAMFGADAPKLDVEATGFDLADVYKLFGENVVAAQPEAAAELAEKARSYLHRYDDIAKRKHEDENDPDFFVVVVFRDKAMRRAFCASAGLPDDRFQDGRRVAEMLSVDLDADVNQADSA